MLPSTSPPRPIVLEEVIAWRAATMGWVWICLTMAIALVKGLDPGLAGKFAFPLSSSGHPLLMALLFGLGALSANVWIRLRQVADLGYLNFTVSRMGWMIVITVLGAGLWAAPAGAFPILMETLTNLPNLPEESRSLVITRLVMGQGMVIAAALPWLAYIVLAITRLQSRLPTASAGLIWFMLLFCGFGLAAGAETAGLLFFLAEAG